MNTAQPIITASPDTQPATTTIASLEAQGYIVLPPEDVEVITCGLLFCMVLAVVLAMWHAPARP